jgi:hypothetical protein
MEVLAGENHEKGIEANHEVGFIKERIIILSIPEFHGKISTPVTGFEVVNAGCGQQQFAGRIFKSVKKNLSIRKIIVHIAGRGIGVVESVDGPHDES